MEQGAKRTQCAFDAAWLLLPPLAMHQGRDLGMVFNQCQCESQLINEPGLHAMPYIGDLYCIGYQHAHHQHVSIRQNLPAKMKRKKNSIAATLTSRGTASRKHTTMERRAANLHCRIYCAHIPSSASIPQLQAQRMLTTNHPSRLQRHACDWPSNHCTGW